MATINKINVNSVEYDLNADTVDGKHASDFAILAGTNNFTGKNIFPASSSYGTVDQHTFVVGNNTSAFVFGADGIQAFAGIASDTPSQTYINYYGGDVNIGSAYAKVEIDTVDSTTIKGFTSDTPLYVSSGKAQSSYLGFKDKNNTELGYIGINGNSPVFYDNGPKTILHAGNYTNYVPTVTIKSWTSADM